MHPITGKIRKHNGVDLKAAMGEDVLAVASGTVSRIGFDFNEKAKTGWGRYVVINHADGSKTLYAHLIEISTNHLKVNDQISQGDVLGKSDTTGGATAPHLHLQYAPDGEIYKSESQIDPYPCIKEPITVTSIEVGDIDYGSYRFPLTIHLNIPPGNGVSERMCEFRGDRVGCLLVTHPPSSTQSTVTHSLQYYVPRGQASVVYKVTDDFNNVVTKDFQVSWDCCNNPDPFYNAFGIESVCYALGDNRNVCGQ